MNGIDDALVGTAETLMFLPLIVFCFLPVMDKVRSSFKKLISKVILSIMAIEVIIFAINLIFPYNIATSISVFLCITMFCWLYQREVCIERFRLWFIFMTACLIGGFGYLAYNVTQGVLHSSDSTESTSALISLLFQILFECIIILILYYPTKKHLKWLLSNFHKDSVWRIVWIFPMLFTLIFSYFVPDDNSRIYVGQTMEMYLVAIFIFLVTITALYVMFYLIARSITENERITEQTLYLKIEAEQYRLLQNHIQDTSRMHHDLRHQLTALSDMLEHQKYKEAEKLLSSYHATIPSSSKQYCSLAAVNAVLNHYNSICQENEIANQFSIRLPAVIGIEDIDFCVLLGNLLENALHGCKSIAKNQREIILKIRQTAPHIIALTISNPCSGIILKNGEVFFSSKHNGEGQGLKSVTMIAEKYSGSVKIEYDQNRFLVKVLLSV